MRAAKELAGERRRVIALWPRTKRPIREAWQCLATSDLAVIEAEWYAYPDANPGVVGGDGLAIVDVDPPKGGWTTLFRLEIEHGALLPPTRTVRTGSDGRHFWFATDGDVASWNPGPGLEVRAAGRQCVAPPSIHPNGNRYEWIDRDAPLAPLPAWLVKKPKPKPEVTFSVARLADPIMEVPPTIYVPALTGLELNRFGFIVCPLHADTDPSLKVYDDAERGWFCFGCERGGTIIDLAGALAGLDGPIRGRDFLAILDYLRGRFG
jgi:hypothetical protein